MTRPVKESSVVGNAAWFIAGDLAGKVASFVLVVVLARGLGAREYGYFFFALSFFPLFMELAEWGIDTTTVREVAQDRQKLSSTFVNGLIVRTVLGLLAISAAVGISPLLLPDRSPLLAIAILAGALWIDELSAFLGFVFLAFERMRFNAMLGVVNRALSTLLAIVVLVLGGGLTLICVTYLLGSVGALLSGAAVFARFFPRVDWRDVRRAAIVRLVRGGAPHGLGALLTTAVVRIDAVLVLALLGPSAAGMYGVATRFFEPLLFVSWGIAAAAMPRLVADEEREGGRTFESSLAALLAFYLPLVVLAPFTSHWLVVTLFSPRYEPAVPAVVWLVAAACLWAIAHLARTGSLAAGRRGEIAWCAAVTLAFNVVANLIVIPRHGFVGAAVVMFFTEVVEAASLIVLYARRGGTLRVGRAVLVPLVASTALAAVLAIFGLRDAPAAVVGVPVYAATLLGAGCLVLRGGPRSVLRQLRNSLREGPLAPKPHVAVAHVADDGGGVARR